MKVNSVSKYNVLSSTKRVENPNSKNNSSANDYFSAAPLDTRLLTESFLSKKDLISLSQTNKISHKSFQNNFHWKKYLKYLKPELQKNIAPGQAMELYKNPANWQDKYVPTNKLGMEFLQNKGRFFNTDIFNDAFVLTCIKRGMISILDASRLTKPPASRFSSIEKTKIIQMLIICNKLTIQETLNLTRQQVKILENKIIFQYIMEDKLTVQEVLDLSIREIKILKNEKILSYINQRRLTVQQALSHNPIAPVDFFILSLYSSRYVYLIAFICTIFNFIPLTIISLIPFGIFIFNVCNFLLNILYSLLIFKNIIDNYEGLFIERYPALKINLKGVEKYINEGKLSVQEALNTEPCRLKNLNYTSIQNCISLGKITVEDALNLSSFRARFFNFFKNIPTGCYIDFKMNQRKSEVTNEILRIKCRDRYFVCKNDTSDNLVLLKVDGKGRVESYSGDRESNFQINMKGFIVIHDINIDSRFRISREQFDRLITQRGGPILD